MFFTLVGTQVGTPKTVATQRILASVPTMNEKKSKKITSAPKLEIKTYISKKNHKIPCLGGEVGTNRLKSVHSKG
ncbi:hypothetical protein NIES4071_00330 [Calothrix sp. NIES-4071]|nr:hypothetical protein NIES4071_00330 [Calothrix sp. NIES-4071]BAZ54380.1 hypothetical protein NIES4105_00330 [Calothrix sp. NIES-4105]